MRRKIKRGGALGQLIALAAANGRKITVSGVKRWDPPKLERVRILGPLFLGPIKVPPSVNELFANVKHPKTPAAKGRNITPRYAAWRALAKHQLALMKPPALAGAYQVTLSYCEDETKADIENLAKAMLDLLVDGKVLEDDRGAFVRRVIVEWGEHPTGVMIRLDPVAGRQRREKPTPEPATVT